MFTAFLIGRAISFAPDAQKAKLSASRIFTLVNRCPDIDNYSQDGEKLVSILNYNMLLSTSLLYTYRIRQMDLWK